MAATAAVFLTVALLVGGGLWWKADQEARATQKVLAALADAASLEEGGRWPEAHVPVASAVALAGGAPEPPQQPGLAWKVPIGLVADPLGDIPEALQRRVQDAKADLEMVDRLEDLDVRALEILVRAEDDAQTDWDGKVLNREYAAAFQDYGAEADAGKLEGTAGWVGSTPVRERLVEAVERWVELKRQARVAGADELEAMLRRGDPNTLARAIPRTGRARGSGGPGKAGDGGRGARPAVPYAGGFGHCPDKGEGGGGRGKHAAESRAKRLGDFRINFLLAAALDASRPAGGKTSSLEDVVAFSRAALALRPRNPRLYVFLGRALFRRGQLDDAAVQYRRAIELNDDYAMAHNNLGEVLYQQGHVDEAAAEFQRAVALRDDLSDLHYNLGLALQRQGRFEQAIPCLQRALDLLSASDPRRVDLKRALFQSRRLAPAGTDTARGPPGRGPG